MRRASGGGGRCTGHRGVVTASVVVGTLDEEIRREITAGVIVGGPLASPALLPVTVTSGIASAGGASAACTGWDLIGAACIEAPAHGRLSCLPANGIWP